MHILEAAEEWLGKGLLTSLRFAQEGQVRLPALLQEFLTSQLRVCTRLARLPHDELSDRSPARGSREAPGAFQVQLAEASKATNRSFLIISMCVTNVDVFSVKYVKCIEFCFISFIFCCVAIIATPKTRPN